MIDFNINRVNEAVSNTKGVIKETPLIKSNVFSREFNNEIYLKPENLQVTGAFKIRGAYNKICKLTNEEKARGIIASSAGNHAQGVAFSGKSLGVKSTIVMPKHTPLIKIDSTKSYGADVRLFGDFYDEAYLEAKRLEKEHNYVFIHPFNDIDVIAGQGTIGYEILKELEDVDYILVPVGGGGLIAGIAATVKIINPRVKIIGVEPIGAMAMKKSIDAGHLVELDNVNTIAEGVAVKKPGEIPFELIKEYVDDIVTVSDFDIMESFLILLEKHKLVSENAGALSIAGIKKLNVKDKKIVSVISGGNIDVLTIASLINKGLVSRGRLFCFNLELPDTPGEIMKISDLLYKNGANIVQLNHDKFKSRNRFNNVILEVTVETNGNSHVEGIIKSLQNANYSINRIY